MIRIESTKTILDNGPNAERANLVLVAEGYQTKDETKFVRHCEELARAIEAEAWYQRIVKGRLDLIKKIVIYGTIVLWAAIWMATRGDEKASVGSLLRDMSNAWSKQETADPPTAEKKTLRISAAVLCEQAELGF